jgi:hypothetical protein
MYLYEMRVRQYWRCLYIQLSCIYQYCCPCKVSTWHPLELWILHASLIFHDWKKAYCNVLRLKLFSLCILFKGQVYINSCLNHITIYILFNKQIYTCMMWHGFLSRLNTYKILKLQVLHGFKITASLVRSIGIVLLGSWYYTVTNENCLGKRPAGRMPCLAAYTRLKNWSDRIKLSSLHRSGNILATTSKRNIMFTVPSLHRSGNQGVE